MHKRVRKESYIVAALYTCYGCFKMERGLAHGSRMHNAARAATPCIYLFSCRVSRAAECRSFLAAAIREYVCTYLWMWVQRGDVTPPTWYSERAGRREIRFDCERLEREES